MALNIAILEDEEAQSQLLSSWLSTTGHHFKVFATGQALLDALEQHQFDLFLLDWELPDINGPLVMQHIRESRQLDTPIIFTTSRDSEDDIVSALNAGADDYLIKPIKQFEFLARIKANTKRANDEKPVNERIELPPYAFQTKSQQVFLHDQAIELSGKEFELAFYLFTHEGQLLERKDILSIVWQQEAELNTRTVDTHASIVRKKLKINADNGWRLKSIYGHGYRLEKLA